MKEIDFFFCSLFRPKNLCFYVLNLLFFNYTQWASLNNTALLINQEY
ncbi:protein of unknown function [Flavobacterium collinsii]|uniref:Uncharacterized protein n=1 Tax=Flavobacterium collinsii TaxID=1114861 RepID=A0A9W4TI64_9FLAO|nr:protein of unknown function [Flavobacterium collinsii]